MTAKYDRREFIRRSATGSAALAMTLRTADYVNAEGLQTKSANDRITVGFIGTGARVHQTIEAVKQVPGVEIVALCDAYKGRLERAQERTKGRARIYRNHQELLAADGIDAVVVSTPDHLHRRHVTEALAAGKDVYVEKPMMRTIDEGHDIINAARKYNRIVQVGSQGMSSAIQQKAREIIASGRLGQITQIRAYNNRNSAGGAWVYPIPPDASPETVNWEMFLGEAKKIPYNPEHFFRWRCYAAYSGGIATDLLVHLLSTIHFVMDTQGPEKVMALGSLYRWKDGRDVPDTLDAVVQYPQGFTVNLSSTFNNSGGSQRGFNIMGTEGTLNIGGNDLVFTPESRYDDNGWIVASWPRALEEAYYKDPQIVAQEMPRRQPQHVIEGQERWTEIGYDDTVAHFMNFFSSVRTRKAPVEDAVFGHRAASVAHMINQSAREQKVVQWDHQRDNLKLV